MKKRLSQLLLYLFLLLLILFGIVLIRTVAVASRQIEVAPAEPLELGNEVVRRLGEAIQIRNISFEDHIDSVAFRRLNSFMDTHFTLVDSTLEKTIISEFSRIYHWPGKRPALKPILLMAHLDVVPVEEATLGDWQQDPFSGKVEGGFIWGRGTLDDKGSSIAILEAIEILLAQNYQPERSLYLAFGHDEEIGGTRGARIIARQLADKGIHFEYALDEGMVILEEALPGVERPVALIGVAEKGFVTLQLNVQLSEGGHSSMPPKETAIDILSKAIIRLRANPFPASLDGPARQLFEYVAPEMNAPYKSVFSNLWLFGGLLKYQLAQSSSTNAVLRTTTAPTIFHSGVKDNVLPSVAEAKVNFRIRPGETVDFVKDYVEKVIDDGRVHISIANPEFAVNPSPVSSTQSFGFEVLEKTIKEVFPGVIIAPNVVVGATDSRYFAAVADQVYRFFPVQLTREDLNRFHGINERITVEGYKDAIRFYHRLILNSCK